MFYKFLDKKTAGSGIKCMQQKEQLAKELQKPIIKKLKKEKYIQPLKIISGLQI